MFCGVVKRVWIYHLKSITNRIRKGNRVEIFLNLVKRQIATITKCGLISFNLYLGLIRGPLKDHGKLYSISGPANQRVWQTFCVYLCQRYWYTTGGNSSIHEIFGVSLTG